MPRASASQGRLAPLLASTLASGGSSNSGWATALHGIYQHGHPACKGSPLGRASFCRNAVASAPKCPPTSTFTTMTLHRQAAASSGYVSLRFRVIAAEAARPRHHCVSPVRDQGCVNNGGHFQRQAIGQHLDEKRFKRGAFMFISRTIAIHA